MCGICGELRLASGPPLLLDDIVRMREALAHRGPDAAGVFVAPDGAASLGFRRLSIVDLSVSASQPLPNEDRSIHLVCNGEIYNFAELRRDLEQRGHQFRSRSDCEVALHLYEEQGPDFVRDLEGMFALAIWDQRQSRLTLARDRAGKKPLFYYRDSHRLSFASEIKSFFHHPGIPTDVDERAVVPYFLFGYVPAPNTFYRGIAQLEPATVMVVERDGHTVQRQYWQIRMAPAVRSTPPPPKSVAIREIRRRLIHAVEKRLVSDVPLGAFLSGGVDSTIVVGIMSRLMGGPVKTFSIGFEGDPRYDETRYARVAAKRFETEHTEFTVRPADLSLVESLIWHHDGPFGDASAIPTHIVARLARKDVTVVLTGEGGDELFAGYQRFAGALLSERIPGMIRRALATAVLSLPSPSSDRHILDVARRFARKLEAPMVDRLTSWIGVFYDDLEDLLEPGFLQRVRPIDRHGYFGETPADVGDLTPLGRLLRLTFRSYLPDDVLAKVDRCTMACALEARCPYLDREVVDYVALLPDEMKLRGRRSKVILKEAFADLLPPEIARRSKMGFAVPLAAWFRGAARDYAADTLLAPHARYTTYVSRDRVRMLVHQHLTGRANVALQLWSVLCFELWLKLLPSWRSPTAVETAAVIVPAPVIS